MARQAALTPATPGAPEVKSGAKRGQAGPSWRGVVGIGILAASLSLLRLFVANPASLTEVMWAEDGLFPLCVRKAGALDCTLDAFAGYFLFVPRIVAVGVAALPMSSWPLVAAVIASVIAATAASVVWWVLRRNGQSVMASLLAALVPVLLPVLGQEAIASVGSAYIVMLYATTMLLAFPNDSSKFPSLSTTAVLVTSLTIPSAIVFAPIIAMQAVRGRIRRSAAIAMSIALVVGLVVQALVALTAAARRGVAPSVQSAYAWVDGMAHLLLGEIPLVSVSDAVLPGPVPMTLYRLVGMCAVAVSLALGIALIGRRRSARAEGLGWLLIVGTVTSAIPTIIGVPSHRYYIPTLMLWLAAVFIAADEADRKRERHRWLPAAAALFVVAGVVGFPADAWRATPSPSWSEQLAGFEERCGTNSEGRLVFVFTPSWPLPDTVITPPTSPDAPCGVLDQG